MENEASGHTLNATDLVHEADLHLTGDEAFTGKAHILRAAAEAMRRILIDHARNRAVDKRGDGLRRGSLKLANGRFKVPLLAIDPVIACLRDVAGGKPFSYRHGGAVKCSPHAKHPPRTTFALVAKVGRC